jgi:protein TonB
MTGTGFYEQRSFSPTGLGVVIALHAAALGALALAKPAVFVDAVRGPLRIIEIDVPDDPPPVPPPPTPQVESTMPQVTRIDTPATVVDLPFERPVVTSPPAPPPPLPGPAGTAVSGTGAAVPELPPMRIDAEFDPRFADMIQPPYPPSEERAQREGSVRLRVTIGADGRVKAVERLSATSDAFWRAAERHALARWRFRPATVDGRAVESRKVLSLHFRLEG